MKKNVLAAAITSLSFYAGGVLAQDVVGETKKRSNRLLEEVVVTAQKREEDSQDVPISIQAFSGEKLDAFGIEDTADLEKITPGLSFTYTLGYTVVYLRGVGSDGFLPNADPSIATYIDGINIPATQGKQDALGPVKRVEVLKGPQGTLFGRNATGGAISIVTEDPPLDEIVGSIQYAAGNYDSQEMQAYFAFPLWDGAGLALAGFEDTHENYGTNFVNGVERPGREDHTRGLRAKFKWDIVDSLSLTLIASQIDQYNGASLVQENTRPTAILNVGATPDPLDRNTHTDQEGGNSSVNELFGATIEWRPGPVDVKFIYGDQFANADTGQYDYDSTDEPKVGFVVYNQPNEQKTYELQVLSNAETPFSDSFEWVAGLYHLEGEGGFDRLFLEISAPGLVASPLGNLLGGLVEQLTDYIFLESSGILATEATSAFFQGTYKFTDELLLTLGARYQEETRGISNTYLDLVNPLLGRPPQSYFEGNDYSRNIRISNFSVPDINDTTVSPKIAVQWFATDNSQVYSSLQRAYKSPTYNIVNFFGNPDPTEREEVTAFEIGFKSEWLDSTLRLNGAAYYTETKELVTALLSLTSGGIVRFDNAGEAITSGAEIDFQWQPMPNWNPGLAITGGMSYIDAEYTDYKDGAGFDDDTGLYFGPNAPTDTVGDLLGIPLPITSADFLNGPRDFTGNRVVRTPRTSSSVSLNQFIEAGDIGNFEFGLDYSYKGEIFTTPQNSEFFIIPQYEIWSARASWFYDPWGIQLTGFVNNLKDKDYLTSRLASDFGRGDTLAPPKLYGLKLKWNFDTFLN